MIDGSFRLCYSFRARRDTYDVRVPACATDSVSSDVFTEPIIFGITIDWIGAIEWLIEGIYHMNQYSPTWNSGYPLTLPEVGCL